MVYKLYVDTIGYISPIREKITKDEDRYQVYIMDLGNGEVTYYGVTFIKKKSIHGKNLLGIIPILLLIIITAQMIQQ
jgi:hypothetical protein